jgi:hypothetical protein
LGGSTILRGAGVQPVRCIRGQGGGTSAGVEHERRKQLKRKQEKETRALIEANEKLVQKLSKQWLAEKGRKHFERLTAECGAKHESVTRRDSTGAAGKALANALEEAFRRRDGDKATT